MRATVSILLAMALLTGCVHSRAPRAGDPTTAQRAPSPRKLLTQLEAQEKNLSRYYASGRLVLKLPDDAAAYSFRGTRVYFEAPGRLRVDARKHGSRAFVLTADGDAFVVVSSAKKGYFHGNEETGLDGLEGGISPAALAAELLSNTDWSQVSPRHVAVTDFDAALGETTLEVYDASRPKKLSRRLVLLGGPPWRVVFEQRFDPETGAVLAETTRDDYAVLSGVLLPRRMETHFPGRDAWMRLEIRELDTQPTFEAETFDVGSALNDARRRGYARMEIVE